MTALLIILVAYAVLTPLEVRLSGRSTRARRTNLVLIVPVMAAAVATDLALVGVTSWGERHGVGLVPWLGLPAGAAFVLTFLAVDFSGWFGHWLRHRCARLWAFHRAHHTDPDVDVTTTLRNHPVDIVLIGLVGSAAVLLLGADPIAVAVSSAIGAVFGLWDHARVRLPAALEQRLALVVQTPGLHRVHHSPHRSQTDSNYGLVLSVWDRIFGTWSPPDPSCRTGLDTADLSARQGVLDVLVDPWRPQQPISDGVRT